MSPVPKPAEGPKSSYLVHHSKGQLITIVHQLNEMHRCGSSSYPIPKPTRPKIIKTKRVLGNTTQTILPAASSASNPTEYKSILF